MSDIHEVAQKSVKPRKRTKPRKEPKRGQLPPYHVVLLDDNQHTYDYVIDMLRNLFGHSEQQAMSMAKQVDRTGRSIVCTTHKERAELKRDQILSFGCDFRIATCKSSMQAVVEPAPE